jgi:hypothetical protein
MSELRNHRRYLLMQSFDAQAVGDHGLVRALRGQQQALAGSALASSVPGYSLLIAAGYVASEDLDGATADELNTYAGLSRREAEQAFTLLGLTPPSADDYD